MGVKLGLLTLRDEHRLKVGRAIAQAVSHWLSTAAARVRAQVWSCGICGGQSGAGAGFLRVLRGPHQLLHNHPHLSSGACTIDQKWPQYLVDLVPPH
jgi:ribosomal protein L37AE/L43A